MIAQLSIHKEKFFITFSISRDKTKHFDWKWRYDNSSEVHTRLIDPGRDFKVLIWLIQTMITRMWAGEGTRLSCCRQSVRGNINGMMASWRRAEWNVCHVVFITLTPSLSAWRPFFGMVLARPCGPYPIHLSCSSIWVILGNPTDWALSHCDGMKEFPSLNAPPLPTPPATLIRLCPTCSRFHVACTQRL